MFNQGFNTTERFSKNSELAGRQELESFSSTTLEQEGDHTTKTSLLLLGKFVLGVRFKTREDNLLNERMLFEPLSNGVSVSAVNLHSGFEGLKTSDSQIAIESRGTTTEGDGRVEELILVFLTVEDQSTHDNIRVTTDVLRDGVEGNINTQIHGVLQVGGSEGVINQNPGIGLLFTSDLNELFDVDKLDEGVGGGFDPDQGSVFLESSLESFDVGKINEIDSKVELFDGESSQVSVGTTIDIIRNNDVRFLGEGVEDTGHSSTTGGESNSVFTIFTSSNTFFEGVSGRGTTSSVFELGIEISGGLLGEGSTQMDGNVDGSVNLIRFLTGMDGLSGETLVLLV